MSLSVEGSGLAKKDGKSAAQKKMEQVTAEQAWVLMEEKFSERFRSVREAWIMMDSDRDGYLGMAEVKGAMTNLGVSMSGHELRRLWRKFDTSGDGKVSYTEFNNKVGTMIRPPNNGLYMPRRPETPAVPLHKLKLLAAVLRRKIDSIEETFKDMDLDESGEISHAEFIQALRKLGLRGIGDVESFGLMQKYKRPGNDSGCMTLEEFRDCMTSLMKIEGGDAKEIGHAAKLLESAEAAVTARLPNHSKEACMRVLSQFDEEGLGDLSETQFRGALASLGVTHLSDEQFAALWGKYDPIDDGSIGISEFAAQYCIAGAASETRGTYKPWVKLGFRPLTDPVSGKPLEFRRQAKLCSVKLGCSESEGLVIIAFIGRLKELEVACKAADKDNSEDLSRLQFKNVLDGLGLDVDENSLNALVSKFDKARCGRIKHREFLQLLGRYMLPTDHNLEVAYLERVPGFDSSLFSANASESAVLPPARVEARPPWALESDKKPQLNTEAPTARRPLSNVFPVAQDDDEDDRYSLPTAAMDLVGVAKRISKVLGKGAVASLAAEVKAHAAFAASQSGASSHVGAAKGATSAATARSPQAAMKATVSAVVTTARQAAPVPRAMRASAVVPGELLRDALAKRGVALTAKEVRAMSLKFGGQAGAVDVDRMVAEMGAMGLASVEHTQGTLPQKGGAPALTGKARISAMKATL